MKKVAIVQSNYIPWKGYFDMMNQADVFVLYDEVQYTKNDWRNRNRIKTANGTTWLTIPIRQEKLAQRIIDSEVSKQSWRKKHWSSLCQAYGKTPYFDQYRSVLETLYLTSAETRLSQINYSFIMAIKGILNIETPVLWSSDFTLVEGKTARLADLCQQLGADEYISGPAAKDYLDLKLMEEAGIRVRWMDYSYPEYPQLYPPFEHAVSVLDLIFNTGEAAGRYMRSFN